MRKNNIFQTQTTEEKISPTSVGGDIFAWLLIAFSEFGFAFLSADNTIDTLYYPLKRYMDSPSWVYALINKVSLGLGLTDSILTVSVIGDTRKQRVELIDQYNEGIRELKARWGARELHALPGLPSLATLLKYKSAYLLFPAATGSSGRLFYIKYIDYPIFKQKVLHNGTVQSVMDSNGKIPVAVEIPINNAPAVLERLQLITGKTHLLDLDVRRIIENSSQSISAIHFIDPEDKEKKPRTFSITTQDALRLVPSQHATYFHKALATSLFIMNLSLVFLTFFFGSLAPGAGMLALRQKGLFITNSLLLTNVLASITFGGQLLTYLYSFAKYIFGNPVLIEKFLLLSLYEKMQIFKNLASWKGSGLILRTLINAGNRGMVFAGLTSLVETYVLNQLNREGNEPPSHTISPFAILVGFSAFYQTVMGNAVKDYRVTFSSTIQTPERRPLLQSSTQLSELSLPGRYLKTEAALLPLPKKSKLEAQMTSTGNHLKSFITLLLVGLTVGTFLARTLSGPSLYTGEIKDPEHNYGFKEILLSALALILGPFAYFQYCRFQYGLGEETINSFLDKCHCLWRTPQSINSNNNGNGNATTPTGDSHDNYAERQSDLPTLEV